MWLDPMVLCVDMANNEFGKTKRQVTYNFYVILRNLDILSVMKTDSKIFQAQLIKITCDV